jgi:hypothetical protein
MTDQQIWTLFWSLVTYAGTGIGTVAFATWWLKSALTNAQISGLEAEIGGWKAKNEVLEERRHLAEDQLKISAAQLITVKAELVLSKRQIEAGATKDELFRTISSATVSANNAISANNQTSSLLAEAIIIPRRS